MTDRGNVNKKVLTIYLEGETLSRFKAKCAIEGKPMTQIIAEKIKEFLKG